MEKKAYSTPNIEVVSIFEASIIAESNFANSTSGNVFNGPITGGNDGARSNGRRGWSGEW